MIIAFIVIQFIQEVVRFDSLSTISDKVANKMVSWAACMSALLVMQEGACLMPLSTDV